MVFFFFFFFFFLKKGALTADAWKVDPAPQKNFFGLVSISAQNSEGFRLKGIVGIQRKAINTVTCFHIEKGFLF